MNRFLLTAAAAATFVAGGTLFAQNAIQATVPFEFYVGKALMPAGTYRIAPCSTGSPVVMVRHCSEGIAAMHLTLRTGTQPKDTGVLVFHKYGDKYYFLNEVQGLPASGNLTLPISETEKSVQAEQAMVRTYEEVIVPKPEKPQ
jgi:hypothetical protein